MWRNESEVTEGIPMLLIVQYESELRPAEAN